MIPAMDTGATDGIYLIRAGIPTYGVSGIFNERTTIAPTVATNEYWSKASMMPSTSSTT